jgi:ribosomal protein S27E
MSNVIQLHFNTKPEDLTLTCGQCGNDTFYLLATSEVECAKCNSLEDGLIWGCTEPPELPPAA